jgi:DME family drug/metabolite transporter
MSRRQQPRAKTQAYHRATLRGYAAVAAAAALWAVGAVVARRLFDKGVDPIQLTESRAILAFAGFALLPRFWRRPRRSRPALVLVLGVALALVNASYYVAVSRIPVAVAIVVQYTAPALIVVWTSIVSRRAPRPDILAALLAALVGVALVVDLPARAVGRLDAGGVAVAVASALLFASYILLVEKTEPSYGSLGATGRGFAVASLFWLAYQTPHGFPQELITRSNVPEILYIGVAGTLVPFLLFVWGVGQVRAQRAAIVATLEPVIAAVVAWVWLGQSLSVLQAVGGLLVVAAVVFLQMGDAGRSGSAMPS